MKDIYDQPKHLRRASVSIEFSSPLPPAEILMQYQQVNLLDKVVEMIEVQAAHRRQLEIRQQEIIEREAQAAIRHQKRRDKEARRGQIYALYISLLGIGGAILLGYYGYQWASSVLGVGGLTSLAARFIYGRKKENH